MKKFTIETQTHSVDHESIIEELEAKLDRLQVISLSRHTHRASHTRMQHANDFKDGRIAQLEKRLKAKTHENHTLQAELDK